jgi:hypothetical protein
LLLVGVEAVGRQTELLVVEVVVGLGLVLGYRLLQELLTRLLLEVEEQLPLKGQALFLVMHLMLLLLPVVVEVVTIRQPPLNNPLMLEVQVVLVAAAQALALHQDLRVAQAILQV